MKIKIFILIVVVFMLTACSGNSGGGSNVDQLIKTPYVGKEGINIEYIKGVPPDFVYQDSEFQVGYRIENNGAYYPGQVVTQILFDPFVFTSQDPIVQTYAQEFKPRDAYGNQGDFYIGTYNLKNYAYPQNGVSPITINNCYQYAGRLKDEILVSSDINKLLDPNSLGTTIKQHETMSYSGQGGPVGIEKIDKTFSPTGKGQVDVVFEIFFNNYKKGKVREVNSYSYECGLQSGSLPKEATDVISFNQMEFSNYNLGSGITCQPQNIKLIGGKAKVVCRTSLNPADVDELIGFPTPLIIEYSYGYVDSIKHDLKVRQIPT